MLLREMPGERRVIERYEVIFQHHSQEVML